MSYWTNRQKQLNKQMEKDEAELKKRLSSFYDKEYARLEKEIALYYQKYGIDSVIQYRTLMEQLSDVDRKMLIEEMDMFAEKYPQYADLMPIRKSIYKLNRLEGLQYSIIMQQLKIGAVNNEEIKKHLDRNAMRSVNAAAEALGFGKNFYFNNPDIVKQFVNVPWSDGKNFSQRIWENTDKLANYLNADIAQGMARGDSYEKLVKQLRKRFENVTRRDAYRLIYTEGTYVMAESTMQPFTEDFETYKISTVGDGKVCPICRELAKKVFRISDRQAGTNFPPLHPWCRCTFEIVVDDWDKWMDDYEKKYGNNMAMNAKKRLGAMLIEMPEEMYKIQGMLKEDVEEIKQSINSLKREYQISIDSIEVAKMKGNTIFGAAPYVEQGKLKFALVLNEAIDYTKVKKKISNNYEKNRFAGKSIEDYIAHEMAHIMIYQDCSNEREYRNKKKIITKQFIGGISQYADKTKNGEESIAEAFVRKRNGEDIPIKAENLLRAYIERWKK